MSWNSWIQFIRLGHYKWSPGSHNLQTYNYAIIAIIAIITVSEGPGRLGTDAGMVGVVSEGHLGNNEDWWTWHTFDTSTNQHYCRGFTIFIYNIYIQPLFTAYIYTLEKLVKLVPNTQASSALCEYFITSCKSIHITI